MSDILSSSANRRNGTLLSASHIAVSTGSGQISLGAQASGNYTREIAEQPVFGSTDIHFLVGSPSGGMQIGTLVGEQGWFAAAKGMGDPCTLQSISVNGRGACGSSDSFRISGALLRGVGFAWQSGPTPVTDSAEFRFGRLG